METRGYDETSMPHYTGPAIWKFDGDESESVQIKDVLVFNTIEILRP